MAIKKVTKRILTMDSAFRNTPVFTVPYFDEMTRSFVVGGKSYPAKGERGERGEYVWQAETGTPLVFQNTMEGFAIKHGDEFDPEDKMQALILQCGIDDGYIARTREEYNPSQHRFFIQDEEAEAVSSVKKADSILRALQLIGEMTAAEQRHLAIYFGENVLLMSENQINASVKGRGMSDPSSVIEAVSDRKRYKLDVFLQLLVSHRILRINAGNYFDGNNNPFGDIDAVRSYLTDKKNAAIVQGWTAALRAKGEVSESSDEATVERSDKGK